MTIAFQRLVIKAMLLLMLVPHFSLSREIPKAEEEEKKESKTKDLITATSYVYSKNSNGGDSFDHLGPSRFRSIHGLNTGLTFPRFFSRFNFPTKYKAGSFGGVGSGSDGLSSDIGIGRLRLSHGIGKKTFDSGISHLDTDDFGDSISSIGSNSYGPSGFDIESHDESDDIGTHDGFNDHEHEHKEKHQEKGKKFVEESESSGEEDSSKVHKVAEEFDKGEKSKKERAQESGQMHEEAETKMGHEEAEKKYKEKEESVHAAKGEHVHHNEGQRKGHKTTGFHNVYHKDEYKKDTTFYDDKHHDAKHEKYSHEDANHVKAEGEHKKVEKLDAAYEHLDKHRKGFFTNGHQYGVAQGHDREEAIKEYHEKEHDSHSETKHKASNEFAESSHSH